MSYAELKTEHVISAALDVKQRIRKQRQARIDALVRAEIASAKRGIFGFVGADITEAQALAQLEGGDLVTKLDLSAARNLHEAQMQRASRLYLLAAGTRSPTMMVSADDYDAIAVSYQEICFGVGTDA